SSEQIPAIAGNVDRYYFGEMLSREISLTVKFKQNREADVGRVFLIEGVENPEHQSGRNTKYNGLPVGAIKSQKVEYDSDEIHRSSKIALHSQPCAKKKLSCCRGFLVGCR